MVAQSRPPAASDGAPDPWTPPQKTGLDRATWIRHMTQLREAGLYCIIDREFIGRRSPMTVAKAMIAGGARLIQYRDKVSEAGEIYRVCQRLQPLLARAGALFIVNDAPDIALAVGADGVHVGVDDLPVEACRRVVGNTLLVGRSSHSIEEAIEGTVYPIDYLAIGPIFSTTTKLGNRAVGLKQLRQVRRRVVPPLFAIGGITLENVESVMAEGVDGVAVISDILGAPDIADRVRQFLQRIQKARDAVKPDR